MSDQPVNPYAAPMHSSGDDPFSLEDPNRLLAERVNRLLASIVDTIVIFAIFMPIQFLSGFWERTVNNEVGLLEQLGMSFLGLAVFLLLHGYLLLYRGQTIGKLLLKIRIVGNKDDSLLPFWNVIVLRYWWILPLQLLVLFIPGSFDNTLVGFVSIVDVLFIFRNDRRCLHDLIAGSKVVKVL